MNYMSVNDRECAKQAFITLKERGYRDGQIIDMAIENGFVLAGSRNNLFGVMKILAKSIETDNFSSFGERTFKTQIRWNLVRFLLHWYNTNLKVTEEKSNSVPPQVILLPSIVTDQQVSNQPLDIRTKIKNLLITQLAEFHENTYVPFLKSLVSQVNGDLLREAMLEYGYTNEFIRALPL